MSNLQPARKSYRRALALVESSSTELDVELVLVRSCTGRVLARDVVAPVDVPAFRKSAVDGFALDSSTLAAARPDAPVRLTCTQRIRPGDPVPRSPGPSATAAVATGAAIPDGCDAVVPRERVRDDGESLWFEEPISPGKNAISIGEDVRRGQVVLRTGRRLRPEDAGLCASLGLESIEAVRPPRVDVLVTGNEIRRDPVAAGATSVVDSNSIVLDALARRDGAVVVGIAYVPDDRRALEQALLASEADVVLVSGGSSVGDEDHAPAALASLGEVLFHRVAMRPAGPVGLGRIGPKWVGLMPGHPVACFIGYEAFAGPLVRRLGGRPSAWPHPVERYLLESPLRSELGRTDFVRVALREGRACPLPSGGASNLSTLVRSDGLVRVDDDVEAIAAGVEVDVIRLDGW